VYFNLSLGLRESYNFSDWEGLTASSLAQVLGATEKGIAGIGKSAMKAGDILHVYASANYEAAGNGWQPVQVTSAATVAPTEPGNAAPASQSQQFLNQLASMIEVPPPGVAPQHERIIAEELAHAVSNITRRRERERHTFVVASGPAGGEAWALANAIVAAIVDRRTGISIHALETGGSIENLRRLSAGEADYAIVESNVALMAVAGAGPFAGRSTPKLAALGSLFPVSMHVVVPAASPIRRIADLRGRRVNIGNPDSGTHFDTLAILRSYGMALTDFAEATEFGVADASRMLIEGRLDAIFAGGGAPMRDLQRLATEHPVRFLPLEDAALARLLDENVGLMRLTLPANTYPGQAAPVTTVAAVTMLVGTTDAPEDEVAALAQLVFENVDFRATGSTLAGKISKGTALRGVPIPLHPGAARYLGHAVRR
jgi:TRAP transporter TAXI family solute receptor